MGIALTCHGHRTRFFGTGHGGIGSGAGVRATRTRGRRHHRACGWNRGIGRTGLCLARLDRRLGAFLVAGRERHCRGRQNKQNRSRSH